jgi:hypothetical protein
MLNNNGLKLFDVSLNSTKINFYHVQSCSSKEIFAPLKGVGQFLSYLKVVLIKKKIVLLKRV